MPEPDWEEIQQGVEALIAAGYEKSEEESAIADDVVRFVKQMVEEGR